MINTGETLANITLYGMRAMEKNAAHTQPREIILFVHKHVTQLIMAHAI